jgi:hypothetical protein
MLHQHQPSMAPEYPLKPADTPARRIFQSHCRCKPKGAKLPGKFLWEYPSFVRGNIMTSSTELEAATFRKLLEHLDNNKDVQNIDLMILAGFCRNCLGKWYLAAAQERDIELTDDQAREAIYGMPYSQWKAEHQPPATAEQLEAFAQRTAK